MTESIAFIANNIVINPGKDISINFLQSYNRFLFNLIQLNNVSIYKTDASFEQPPTFYLVKQSGSFNAI